MLIGYARVSTAEQSLDAQLAELKAAGCERIFSEKLSGARASDRQALQKLLKQATHGDVVVVTRLDRLARSTRDLLNIIEEFTREGIGFKSLRETSIDTTSATGAVGALDLGFDRRVRARADHGADGRGAQACRGQGRQVWPQVQAQPLPEAGGTRAAGGRRDAGGRCPDLRGVRGDPLPAAEGGTSTMSAPQHPSAGRSGATLLALARA